MGVDDDALDARLETLLVVVEALPEVTDEVLLDAIVVELLVLAVTGLQTSPVIVGTSVLPPFVLP